MQEASRCYNHQINLEVSNTSRINQSFPISKVALKSLLKHLPSLVPLKEES